MKANRFRKTFKFRGSDVLKKKSLGFKVYDDGNKIEINWTSTQPNMDKDIRWKQRFNNYKNALQKLQEAIAEYEEGNMSDVITAGMIKFFEMVYELAWNTMKDYYEDQGETNIQGSKDAIKLAYDRGLITDGDKWFDMVKSRRLSVHTYNAATADEIAKEIIQVYIGLFLQLRIRLDVENLSS